MTLRDAKIGDVVTFHYSGDGKPARNRVIRVTDLHDTYVKAEDLEINEPRNFSFDKASNFLLISKVKVEPTLAVETNDSGYTLTFTNTDGAELMLVSENGNLELMIIDNSRNIVKTILSPKISEFISQLNKHYA